MPDFMDWELFRVTIIRDEGLSRNETVYTYPNGWQTEEPEKEEGNEIASVCSGPRDTIWYVLEAWPYTSNHQVDASTYNNDCLSGSRQSSSN